MEESTRHITDVAELNIKVKEVDDFMWRKSAREISFSKENWPEHFNCSNPRCHEGGVSISAVIRDALKENREHTIVKKKCQGYNGSPKGRKKYTSCIHDFEVTVDIHYVK